MCVFVVMLNTICYNGPITVTGNETEATTIANENHIDNNVVVSGVVVRIHERCLCK